MSNQKYTGTNLVTFTQQCESGQVEQFKDTLQQLEAYAMVNKLTKPKKQELLTYLMKNFLPTVTPEQFFNS